MVVRSSLGLTFAGVSLFTFGLQAGCHPQKAKPEVAQSTTDVGIDESAISRQTPPCDDFYEFACGNWLKRTEIPADRASWLRGFSVIDDRNETELKAILEEAKAKASDPLNKQLGDFYAACMDEEKIEKAFPAELEAQLRPIEAVKDVPTLAKEVARQHLAIGAPLFGFGQQQDFKDANSVIGSADQGGLGLPDRDYYLLDDDRSKELRAKYEAHIAKMLTLSGSKPDVALAQAQAVLKIETELARVSMSRVDRRSPEKIYHRIELKGLVKLAPKFPWAAYLKELGIPQVTQINVVAPDFFVGLNKLLGKVAIPDWRSYLRWQLLHSSAPFLGKTFVDEDFEFNQKILSGTAQNTPRWKRCVQRTDQLLGEALAQAFVKKTFGEEGKNATRNMIVSIEKAMEENVTKLAWMDEPTRKAALAKLAAVNNKVGFPDTWRDYSTVAISRDSYLGNAEAASKFESRRQLTKIGKPVDRNEWLLTPPTVNAYYDPSKNEMVFPAGILQPPFFNRKALDAVNYGAIGMFMGHELTHGFDDEGRKFDPKGNLSVWWSTATNAEFEKRAQCVNDQFSGYVVIDGQKINGKLTNGENIADLGGIKLAYRAWESTHKGGMVKQADGFSDAQLFFLGFAQAWCGKRRPELERQRLVTDTHSTAKFRVNGPLSNLPEFAAAFQCKPGSKMVRENACVVW